MLECAIALDAGLAQANAYLALACVYEYVNAWNGRTASHLEQALELSRKACEVDPLDPMSHHAMAVALMMLRRLDEAESEARRAVELEPNFSLSHGALGNVLHRAPDSVVSGFGMLGARGKHVPAGFDAASLLATKRTARR